jgi:hypothetical protein
MKFVDKPSVVAFSHKNYIKVDIPEGSYGLVRESARAQEKVVIGPAAIVYNATKTSVNGTVINCKRPDLFKGEILTQMQFERRMKSVAI